MEFLLDNHVCLFVPVIHLKDFLSKITSDLKQENTAVRIVSLEEKNIYEEAKQKIEEQFASLSNIKIKFNNNYQFDKYIFGQYDTLYQIIVLEEIENITSPNF